MAYTEKLDLRLDAETAAELERRSRAAKKRRSVIAREALRKGLGLKVAA